MSPAGYVLRDELLHDMRYGFRKNPELRSRVDLATEGKGDADMIQDLNDPGRIRSEGRGYASDYLRKARKAPKKANQTEKIEPSAS